MLGFFTYDWRGERARRAMPPQKNLCHLWIKIDPDSDPDPDLDETRNPVTPKPETLKPRNPET